MINTIQMINAWFAQAMRGFAGYTNATNHEYFFDASADFEAQFGADADLRGYFLELLDGRRFRLFQVISATQVELFDPALELSLLGQRWWIRSVDNPPDQLWAEITYLDNRPAVESNFGRLIGFTLDDLAERTDNLDYLSAVRGLWSYVWDGRTVFKTRVSSQIILGLPFAEERGNIIGIDSPFDGSRNRILIQGEDNRSEVRSYLFPSSLAVEINPATGVSYGLGDSVEQFAPLCEGVVITDYVEEPEWLGTFVGSGDIYEPHKLHTFGVVIDADIFDLVNVLFLSQYLRRYKPIHTDPFFVVLKSISLTIGIDDPVLLGPAVPDAAYSYPDDWPAYAVPIGYADSPHEVPRAAVTAYDPEDPTTYVTDPPVPENLGLPFGGLRLADVPGKAPSESDTEWPSGTPGTRPATISEGSFRFDDTDESGHVIHRWDAHLLASNLLLDGDFEDVTVLPWVTVGATTPTKVGSPVHGSAQSLYVVDAMNGVGVQQASLTALTEGFQVGVNIWVYLVSGQAHFRLLDQDNPQTVLAEWRHHTNQLTWHQLRLHAWEVSAFAVNYVTLQALTGPGGGEFYLGAAGSDAWEETGVYEKEMPWSQWGYDRAIRGRTGGFTPGGLPDEDLVFQLAIPVP